MANGEVEVADTAAEREEADADFSAGFEGGAQANAGTETPAAGEGAPEKAELDPAQPQPTAAPAPGGEAAAGPAEPKMVTISEEELTRLRTQASSTSEQLAKIGKQFDQVFGKVGNLEQVISKLRTETPAGEAVEVTDDDFKELAQEYPELARHTRGALNNVLKRFKGTGGVDPATVELAVAGKLQTALTNEVQEMVLNAVLPDWQTEVNTPKFAEWMKAQAPEVQRLAASDKVADAARMLRLFDRHLSAPAPTPAPTAAPTPAPTASARQRQLASGVTPRGDGRAPAPAPDTDEFEAGFAGR